MREGARGGSAYGWFRALGTDRFEDWVEKVRRGGDCEFRAEMEGHGPVCVKGRKREGSIALAVEPEDGGVAMVSEFHDAADEPCSDYPVDLPFVPGLGNLVVCPEAETRSGVLRVVTWLKVSEPGSVIDEMARQSVESGWTVESRGQFSARMVTEDTSRNIHHLPFGPIRDCVFLIEMGRADPDPRG